ncbi:PD-(D/E)XK nuclease family protein [Actinomyces sp.]|uniref:PD-(D/E)XK nuclease family protein n=1 Tax=Actinomyces sp. TaxID=29317 RepID=UPI00290FD419|nr:PD-(D/E)XK nuclease family protein [Actinomyces sp.]MDU5230832.1 PD-(D/E)XK nuclease family protein [Actinomyces sp.]MDU6756265.1 PD-(D/E)XK nuclease family protein [Actinomyces sp.]
MTTNRAQTCSEVRLALGRPADFGVLDQANGEVVHQVVSHDGPAVIRGCPGSGRTSVAIEVAHQLREKLGGDVFILAPDRLRVDLLQSAGEHALPGIVRPVRTPVALAYSFVSKWYVERKDPQPAPQLLTGAQEDLALAEAIEAQLVEWPESLNDALGMPEFRMQIRNLMARAREAGWDGHKLESVGHDLEREIWVATGRLMQIWQEQSLRESGDTVSHFESAELQERAAQIITRWHEDAGSEAVVANLGAPAAVVVDDLQDCTRATLSLLEALHAVGTRVVVTADSDVAVSVYRGGEPHLDVRFADRLGAKSFYLGPTHRGNQTLRAVVQRVSEQTTVRHDARHRLMGAVDSREDSSGLSVNTYGSAAQEANAIARMITRYQLGRGLGISRSVPLDRQVVITRNSADVKRLHFSLMRNGIESTIRSRATVYAANQTTSILLLLLSSDPFGPTDFELFDRLLRSPLVNAHTAKLRKLSDVYRARIDADVKSVLQMCEDLASDKPEVQALKEYVRKVGLAEVLDDVTKAFDLLKLGRKVRSESPQIALWELWELADVTEEWRQRAIRPGTDSAVFDERLDAVVSLFRSADVWQQRNPGASAEHFSSEFLSQRLPTDTLAQTGKRPIGVQILTVSEAVGQEWDVVYLASMQDGTWPNLALRDQLSQAGDIAQLRSLSPHEWANQKSWNTGRARRKARLTEEYRQLAAAVSRAKSALHVSAVQNEDDVPSQFVYRLAKWVGTPLIDGYHLPVTPVPSGIDTRSLVGTLRQKLAQRLVEDDAHLYASLLALLALAGIDQANPRVWNGVGGLTPTADESKQMVTLSPSQIETLIDCPAKWFLTRHGGSVPASEAILTGNLVHKLAEEWSEADFEELKSHLDELWDDEYFDRETSLGMAEYESTLEKVKKLADYLEAWKGKTVDIEHPFAQVVDIGGTKLRIAGRIDRLEHTEDGVVVTDIKTGRVPSQKETQNHLQLAAYQFALNARGENVQKARLLALREKSPDKYIQHSLFNKGERKDSDPVVSDQRERLAEVIKLAAEIAAGNTFLATPNANICRSCPVKNICPAQDEGRRTL